MNKFSEKEEKEYRTYLLSLRSLSKAWKAGYAGFAAGKLNPGKNYKNAQADWMNGWETAEFEFKCNIQREALISVHERVQELLPVGKREKITRIIADALDKTA